MTGANIVVHKKKLYPLSQGSSQKNKMAPNYTLRAICFRKIDSFLDGILILQADRLTFHISFSIA